MYSSRLSGSGAIALNINSGGPPMQIATGILPPLAAACSAPCLCICQCKPTSFGPKTWARYIPILCSSVTGSLVTTNGSVINGPPSIGQVVGIGSFVTSGSAILTSWQAPLRTFLGGSERAFLARGHAFHGRFANAPISGFMRSVKRSPISLGFSTRSA